MNRFYYYSNTALFIQGGIGCVCIILIFLLISSCNTNSISNISHFELSRVLNTSNYPSNAYIGISGRMSNHEREVEYARYHIAHQIAMRDRCIIDEGFITINENGFDYLISDSNIEYNDLNINDIKTNIEIIDVYIFPELTVVIGKDTSKNEGINPNIPRYNEYRPIWIRNPQWIRNLPDFENYYIGVGISERYSFFYRGIITADIRAAQVIANEIGTYTRNYSYNFLYDTGVNTIETTEFGSIALTQAEIEGFYILDRWIEPDWSMCYSLGIANKK